MQACNALDPLDIEFFLNIGRSDQKGGLGVGNEGLGFRHKAAGTEASSTNQKKATTKGHDDSPMFAPLGASSLCHRAGVGRLAGPSALLDDCCRLSVRVRLVQPRNTDWAFRSAELFV